MINMNTADILRIKTKVSITQLRRNPREILRIAEDLPIAVLNCNKPEFYLFSVKAYEALLDLIDDTSLIKTIQARKGGKTLKAKL